MSLLPLNRRARRAERRRLYLAAACSDNLGRLHKLARRPVFAQGAR